MGRSKPAGKKSAPPAHPKADPPAVSKTSDPLTIVGIGASAGGLEAIGKFFAALPPSTRDLAFVVIQHLDPTHPSLIAELLARHTPMKVVEVTDRMKIEPRRVYVIPPGTSLTLHGYRLRLVQPLERRGMRMPIDDFFRSLAEVQNERAIGIILTGAGSDGSVGLKAIKGHGGMIMAQDPATAAHDGMPRSALQTGLVDFVLPVEKMPETLLHYVQHPYIQKPPRPPHAAEASPDGLQRIITLLRTNAHFDFRQYKNGTLERRVHRRMGLHQLVRLSDYVALLRRNPEEVVRLAKDLLISVTSFFREPEAFAVLARHIFAQLRTGDRDTPVRVWIPACATGEEAYSITMLLLEHMARKKQRRMVQVFATDVDEAALSAARSGLYSLSLLNDVSPERRTRFFTKIDDSHYQVKKELRESVTFARQNLLEDPPFSKLDLISCRNLLIYLTTDAQKSLLERFHFALHPGGCLFLGSAESVGPETGLFAVVSKKWRIFRKIGPSPLPQVGAARSTAQFPALGAPAAPRHAATESALVDIIYRQLLQDHRAPAAALINRRHEILHLFGPVGQFFELASGQLTRNLLELARSGLQTRLRAAVQRAARLRRPVLVKGVRFNSNGNSASAAIAVQPLVSRLGGEALLLVTFTLDSPPGRTAPAPQPTAREGALVRRLEQELKNSRDDLSHSIRDLESANEELRASNEEAVSVNEELQSTNEELETSKEELQSLNEELSTVNAQLHGKIDELENANNDLDNLISSTDQATISLDRQFRINWFTPAMTRLIPLQSSDRGRPLSDLALDAPGADLLRDARAALANVAPVEIEVRTANDRWHLRRTLPYRTKEGRIEGVVVTFVDITDRKNAEQMLLRHNSELTIRVAERTTDLERANTVLRDLLAERERLEALVAKMAESERLRIGVELHDNVSQSIAASTILVSSLAKRLQQMKSPLADAARHAAQALEKAGETTHLLAKGLVPVQVEAAGLMAALSALAERAQQLFGVACDFACVKPVPIADNAVATHLFYIAQEAVNNAGKHGRPQHIHISLRDHETIRLQVRDDGVGISDTASQCLGSGLRIMRYRARLIGADLEIIRAPQGGTLLQCTLPEGSATS